jgi:glycosyltransferase involved in cell wall biosynthesis
MPSPRVSILLTCYNHLRYLPAALDGVLGQTFTDFEVLALDDGSKDGSREWLKAREAEGKLRCIFNEKNLGTYAALNVGLKEAKGEYIAVLNDDDLWGADKLLRQVEMLDTNPKIGLIHTNGWFIDGEGKRIEDPKPLGFEFPRTPTGDVLAMLIHHNRIITSSALVRRTCFDQLGPFDPSFYGCGDWHMWLRVAREWQVGYVDEPLTFYRVHGANASLDSEKMDDDGTRIREWITEWQKDFAERTATEPDLKGAFAHNWACLGTTYTWAGRPGDGRRAYKESVKVLPGRFKSYLRWVATFLPRKAFRKLS